MKSRETMLPELLGELERTRKRRVLRRRSASTVATAAIIAGALTLARMEPAGNEPPPGADRLVERVHTDPSILARYEAPERTLLTVAIIGTDGAPLVWTEWLDDQGLVLALAAAGRPVGLARSGGRVWLTRAVTDAEWPEPS